jgi:acetoin utilization protein AcuB
MSTRTAEREHVIADVMTRNVVTLFEEDDLENIETAMDKFGFHHVPVVDDGKLVGLVTRANLLGVASSTLDPTGAARDERARKRLFVRDVMVTEVRTAHPDTSITDAARLMRDARIGCLPVVEADERLVGIVTSTDMLDLLANWAEEGDEPLSVMAPERAPFRAQHV